MSRPDHVDLARLGQVAQPTQRPEVGAERAVGMSHHRRAAAEHGVAGQHRAVGRQHEAQRVAGVARRADHPDLEAADLDHVTVVQPLVAVHERRVERPHPASDPSRRRRAHPRCGRGGRGSAARPRRRPRPPRPREVPVRRSGPGRSRCSRPLVDGPQDPRVRAVERHRSGVRRQHAAGMAAERPPPTTSAPSAVGAASRVDSRQHTRVDRQKPFAVDDLHPGHHRRIVAHRRCGQHLPSVEAVPRAARPP